MHPSEFDITISEEEEKIKLPLSSLLNLPTYSIIQKSVINIYPFLDAIQVRGSILVISFTRELH